MKLGKLLNQLGKIEAPTSVPDWMMGCFNRRSISFANGETDTKTQVAWLQCRNFTLDLRLPLPEDRVAGKTFEEYSELELRQLANYEGWFARSLWDKHQLSWRNGASLQLHNRWPEPAILKRVGDCMIEFAPSGAYVEDWRLLNQSAGTLVGLPMLYEKNLNSGHISRRGGGLIVCGEYAGLVIPRASLPEAIDMDIALRDQPLLLSRDKKALQQLFDFECSLARGSLDTDFEVFASTDIKRQGQPLLTTDHFELISANQIRQLISLDGEEFERVFEIDSVEFDFPYSRHTPCSAGTQDWFRNESETLQRYSRFL